MQCISGYTGIVTQNSPLSSLAVAVTVPALISFTHERWPGWVGLYG